MWSSRSVAPDYSSHNPSAPTSCRDVLNYNSHNPRRQLLCRVFRELCPISHLPFRFLHTREQGREKRRVWAGAAISSAFGLCSCRRASDRAMLGHSIRRFTTSVVRRSHYEEGPGKVSVSGPGFGGGGPLGAARSAPRPRRAVEREVVSGECEQGRRRALPRRRGTGAAQAPGRAPSPRKGWLRRTGGLASPSLFLPQPSRLGKALESMAAGIAASRRARGHPTRSEGQGKLMRIWGPVVVGPVLPNRLTKLEVLTLLGWGWV